MNILPKKSWHVRTRKNIERVQRDEAEAERLSNIERDRKLRAEQEARLNELRLRAGIHNDECDKRVDLFHNPQEVQGSSNPEFEAEQIQRDAARKVRVGSSNSLSRPRDVSRPWYCTGLRPEPDVKSAKSELITSMYDPMTAIQQAERIVRQRRAEKARLVESASTSAYQTKRKQPTPGSSPEIICEVPRSLPNTGGRSHKKPITEDHCASSSRKQWKKRKF